MTAGQIITKLRQHRRKTRQELADMLGISRQRMGSLENADNISLANMLKICTALHYEMVLYPEEAMPENLPTQIRLYNEKN